MTNQETYLAAKLRDYIETTRGIAGPGERLDYFLDLVRDFVGLQPAEFNVDSEVYAGRDYALLGNLVFAFKGNLHWQSKDAELQLQQFMADLKSRRPEANYFAIVTDGLNFHVYLPQYSESGEVVRLEKAYGLNLTSPMATLEQATNDLGVILSPFRPDRPGHS